ncbi:MAG: hypothetical protein DDG60_16290 [Anaerolineae bacterium]|nr:MAG: hypothetical protein DDG60_16290 [Anaerolineae bacterium]
MMIFRGFFSASKIWVNFLPNEPVPPVTNTDLLVQSMKVAPEWLIFASNECFEGNYILPYFLAQNAVCAAVMLLFASWWVLNFQPDRTTIPCSIGENMVAKVILNPYSNRRNAHKRWPQAEAALRAAGIAFELAVSERPKDVIQLAAQAARQGFAPIIAAGGDGTVGEVVNGLAQVRPETDFGTLGILPLGTANDLAANLGLPRDLWQMARILAAGKTRSIDVGCVNGLYFVNNSAVGLEPYVTQKQTTIHWIKGVARYLVAAVQGIFDHPSWNGRLEWDDGSYEGPLTLVSVGNGARTGGLFYMSPHADPSDGKLTFVYGYRSSRLRLLALLPKTLSPRGEFLHEAGIQEVNCTHLQIRLDRPSPAHADGELFPHRVTEVNYRILPQSLRVLV